MRRLCGLLTPLILITLLTLPTRTMGQGTVRTFTPPIKEIELTWKQPPSSLPSKIFFDGRPTGPGSEEQREQRGIRWIEETPGSRPPIFAYPDNTVFVACGVQTFDLIRGTLTYPSGHQESVRGEHWGEDRDCLTYRISAKYGMELGLYTLTIEDTRGQLTHTWGLDYPACPALGWAGQGSEPLLFVMGLAPNESATIHFYSIAGKDTQSYYAAYAGGYTVQADREGAVALKIEAKEGTGDIAVVRFDPQGVTFVRNEPPHTCCAKGRYLSAKYPTYSVSGYPCFGTFDRFAQTAPSNGATKLPLYPAFNDTSRVVGELEAGIPVEVLKQRPALHNGRVVLWYRVRTENGREGWIYGQSLIDIWPKLAPGGLAEIQYGSAPEYLNVYQTPNLDSPALSTLLPGTLVRLIRQGGDFWWQVRTPDAVVGWMIELTIHPTDESWYFILRGLPWAPHPGSPVPGLRRGAEATPSWESPILYRQPRY